MSSFEADPEVGPAWPAAELLEGAPVALGGPRGFAVTRTLPNRQRRMVGAWCFLDAYGPHDIAGSAGMRVGPHPHTGLQTVTWLVAGEVLHRDTLGTVQEIRPGQLNLMTAGHGIAHAEETPREHSAVLQGVQLWVALPHADRDMPPAFAHHADLPVFADGGLTATVLMGSLAGATSPAACYTPLVGAEITLAAGGTATLPLRTDFEYARAHPRRRRRRGGRRAQARPAALPGLRALVAAARRRPGFAGAAAVAASRSTNGW